MSEITEHLLFIALAAALYIFARKAKKRFSGKNYTKKRYWILSTYNFILTCIYYDFTQTGRIPFYGEVSRDLLGWLATMMAFLHISSFPQEHKIRPWRFKKRFNFKIRKHKSALIAYRKAQENKDK